MYYLPQLYGYVQFSVPAIACIQAIEPTTTKLTNLVAKLRDRGSASVLPETVSGLLRRSWSVADQAGVSRPNGSMSTNPEPKSYLSETLSAFSPWGSRSSTPKPTTDRSRDIPAADPPSAQQGGDHRVSHRHTLSSTNYPRDCPRLDVQWFHAVDVGVVLPETGHWKTSRLIHALAGA